MSGTFPSTPKPSTAKIKSHFPTLVSTAHNMARQARSKGCQRWLIEMSWPIMRRTSYAPIFAFAIAQEGQYETFQLVLPGIYDPQGVATGTPIVSGAHASGKSIPTTGWTASVVGILKAGDFLKFDNHTKVYMVTADASSDGSGSANLSIEPPLVAALVDTESITVTGVPFTVAFDGDIQEFGVRSPVLFSYQASFIEVV